MDYEKVLRQKTSDLAIKVHPLTEMVSDEVIRIKWRVEADGLHFWSDSVRQPRHAAFVFDGATGKRLQGGKYILRITDALDPQALPWPSKEDDPFCATVRACAMYLEVAACGTNEGAFAKSKAMDEIRRFLVAGIGHKYDKFIVVKDYPTS